MNENPIKTCIRDISRNTGGFYNGRKAILPNFDDTMMFFIVGARRIGKTQFFIHLACEIWKRYRIRTLWIRTKLVETQMLGDGFLADAVELGWCSPACDVKADGAYDENGDMFIQFASLSTFSNARGRTYNTPDNPMQLIVYDEFMPEDKKYTGCKSPATALMSLTRSVFSNDPDARCFCLSNSISCINPFYARMKVYPKDSVTRYPEKKITIEKCIGYKQANMSEGNPWGEFYKAVGYGDYADEKDDPRFNLICGCVPKGAKPEAWVVISGGHTYRAYDLKGKMYFAPWKGNLHSIVAYSADRDTVNVYSPYLPDRMRKALGDVLDTNGARFVDANTMFDIMTIVFPDQI